MERVKNKVAVITGGAVGIGCSGCILLAREGAKVAITDVNETEGRKLAEQIRKDGGTAEFWHMNTADEKEVSATFQKISEKFGPINVLVNNAGILGVNKPTDEVTEEEWDKLFDVNVKGVFFCTKHVIKFRNE